MAHHGLAMADVDLWELHEAYAVTTLYNQAQLETPWEITNVNGGAVPLGHPYGMSGIRYLGSTLLELGRRDGAARGRRRLHGGRHGDGGVPRARVITRQRAPAAGEQHSTVLQGKLLGMAAALCKQRGELVNEFGAASTNCARTATRWRVRPA